MKSWNNGKNRTQNSIDIATSLKGRDLKGQRANGNGHNHLKAVGR